MGEPTIYKPSIYKGDGIYKNGAGGGGGGGGNATQYSSIYFSSDSSLSLPQTLEKDNLCIIVSFTKLGNSIDVLKLFNGANSVGYVRVSSSGALWVNNEIAGYGQEIAINTFDQAVIIRQDGFRRFENSSVNNWWCPYQNNNIDKISFGINSKIYRIAFYYGAINNFEQDNKTIDFRPCIEEGQEGFKDIVSGVFYPLANSTVAP